MPNLKVDAISKSSYVNFLENGLMVIFATNNISKMTTRMLFAFVLAVLLAGCGGNDYVPKPRGYYRIDFPEHEYRHTNNNLPYCFEYPTYATFDLRNSTNAEERYWGDVNFKSLNAKIYLSYKPLSHNLDKCVADAHNFVYKHTIKADAISETPYCDAGKRVYGLLYEICGDAASNVQFYLTDSTRNFVRGALYFNAVPNKDSLAPALEFINEDIKHLIESFSWN